MQRKLGAQVARALKLRIAELRHGVERQDLFGGTGRREELTGDREGQWSARLTPNRRLIVRAEARDVLTVTVLGILDYHHR